MTLDEAIKHCLEVAEQNETQAQKIGRQLVGSAIDKYATDCRECAADRRQLAEWLTELKELRNSIGAVKFKDMKEAVGLLQELNTENDQLTSQLAEAKRLLKAAAKIAKNLPCDDDNCGECVHNDNGYVCSEYECFEWRYADEALALIGKDIDAPATEGDTNVGHKSGGWISCKDRLPSENTLVLCYARSKTGEGNGYFLGALAHGEFWFLKVNDIGHVSCPVLHWEVTHWQPLPEPPKED